MQSSSTWPASVPASSTGGDTTPGAKPKRRPQQTLLRSKRKRAVTEKASAYEVDWNTAGRAWVDNDAAYIQALAEAGPSAGSP